MQEQTFNQAPIKSLVSQIARLVITIVILLLPVVLVLGAGYADEPELVLHAVPFDGQAEYNYVGVEGCRLCHRTPAKGDQHGQWSNTLHAKAYETLGSAQSKEIAAKMGIADPQQAEACLVCHVSGADVPPARRERTWKAEDGVGCESCHGPGSVYRNVRIMQSTEESIKNGLWVISEETCLRCHNEKSPTYKPFNYEEALKVVSHPNPQRD